MQPQPARRSRFELPLAQDYDASAAGTMVQASSRILDTFTEEQLAAVAAQEFSQDIATLENEIEALNKLTGRPVVPAWLSERDQPLSGNWQALIVRHRSGR